MSILTLNDDCLDGVLKYFTLDELMDIYGELNERLDDAVERQLHRFRNFEFTMRDPPRFGTLKLQLLGCYLRTIFINVGYSIDTKTVLCILQPLSSSAAQAGHLRALKIQHFKWTSDAIAAVLTVVPLLRLLDISRCEISNEHFSTIMSRAFSLHTLVLVNVQKLNIEVLWHMDIMKNLRCVKLSEFMLSSSPALLCELHKQLTIIVYETFGNNYEEFGKTIDTLTARDKWHTEHHRNSQEALN